MTRSTPNPLGRTIQGRSHRECLVRIRPTQIVSTPFQRERWGIDDKEFATSLGRTIQGRPHRGNPIGSGLIKSPMRFSKGGVKKAKDKKYVESENRTIQGRSYRDCTVRVDCSVRKWTLRKLKKTYMLSSINKWLTVCVLAKGLQIQTFFSFQHTKNLRSWKPETET